jgi:hypothetical protein
VGVQIPRRLYSKVPQEDLVSRTAPASGRCIPEVGCDLTAPIQGLLGVHSRYGLHTRAVTVYRDTLSEGLSHFVTSMTAPVASGWSGCRPISASVVARTWAGRTFCFVTSFPTGNEQGGGMATVGNGAYSYQPVEKVLGFVKARQQIATVANCASS